MPWVRIDEHALNHVKILALSHGAFRLWVEGLAHCQKHLTDGAISRSALRGFRYAARPRVDELIASVDGMPPLWKPDTEGFTVHDYLKWNDSREKVLIERGKAKERLDKFRNRFGNGVANGVQNGVANGARNAFATGIHTTSTTTTTEGSKEQEPSTQRDRFERFWDAYPRKTAKKAAWIEWQRLKPPPDEAFIDRALSAIQQQIGSAQWRKDGGQYIPHPKTWLHQGRWEDQDDAVAPAASRIHWSDECAEMHDGLCMKQWDHEMKKRQPA
jgi:hypothetical protein